MGAITPCSCCWSVNPFAGEGGAFVQGVTGVPKPVLAVNQGMLDFGP